MTSMVCHFLLKAELRYHVIRRFSLVLLLWCKTHLDLMMSSLGSHAKQNHTHCIYFSLETNIHSCFFSWCLCNWITNVAILLHLFSIFVSKIGFIYWKAFQHWIHMGKKELWILWNRGKKVYPLLRSRSCYCFFTRNF